MSWNSESYIAFADDRRIVTGTLPEVARSVRTRLDEGETGSILVIDAETSEPIDLDLRGTPDEVAERTVARQAAVAEATASARRRPGRPKLGVVAREITLLPRHWDWLAAQPGGASVTLRKLVETARKAGHASDGVRRVQDVCYRFMHALAGDLPGFEEATRMLYAWNLPELERLIAEWPPDIREHTLAIVRRAER